MIWGFHYFEKHPTESWQYRNTAIYHGVEVGHSGAYPPRSSGVSVIIDHAPSVEPSWFQIRVDGARSWQKWVMVNTACNYEKEHGLIWMVDINTPVCIYIYIFIFYLHIHHPSGVDWKSSICNISRNQQSGMVQFDTAFTPGSLYTNEIYLKSW